MEHIFSIWPTVADMARELGLPYTTVASWKDRGRIGADNDLAIVKAAHARGATLTLEDIAIARASQPRKSVSRDAA